MQIGAHGGTGGCHTSLTASTYLLVQPPACVFFLVTPVSLQQSKTISGLVFTHHRYKCQYECVFVSSPNLTLKKDSVVEDV